jgi:DNA-binding NtrC family response regulator
VVAARSKSTRALIALTNVDLDDAVKRQNFRRGPVLPSARGPNRSTAVAHRKEDLQELAQSLYESLCGKHGGAVTEISAAALSLLERTTSFPATCASSLTSIERAVIVSEWRSP